jgi:hypothetical protein
VKTIKKKINDDVVGASEVEKKEEESNLSENFGLTEEEEETFGDRFPYGF